jgi:hypothetical protein
MGKQTSRKKLQANDLHSLAFSLVELIEAKLYQASVPKTVDGWLAADLAKSFGVTWTRIDLECWTRHALAREIAARMVLNT